MRRAICTVLVLGTLAAGCARQTETKEKEPPKPSPAVARLLKIAQSPAAALDPLDAPAAPRGFARVDVLRLARWLVDAVERTSSAGVEDVRTTRDAVDHTFAALDMRSRVRIRDLLVSSSRERYRSMPVDWIVVDRWERGHEPEAGPRIVKSAWRVGVDEGHLELKLQVLQAYVSVAGIPMFLDRTFSLTSADPSRSPAEPVHFGAYAKVLGIDRCHVVRTGRFRPETDTAKLAKLPASLERDVKAKGMRESFDGDFRRGCD